MPTDELTNEQEAALRRLYEVVRNNANSLRAVLPGAPGERPPIDQQTATIIRALLDALEQCERDGV